MKYRVNVFITISLIALSLLILFFEKPTNTAFNGWLAREFNIECKDQTCVLNAQEFKIVNREHTDYIFFNLKSIRLERNDGTFMLVESVEILGDFILLTFNPLY